jgi:hypothetical protein
MVEWYSYTKYKVVTLIGWYHISNYSYWIKVYINVVNNSSFPMGWSVETWLEMIVM